MFKAETPGPMKDSKMTPRIAETAKGLWLVYLGVSIACTLAYRVAGMSWFDAICHMFSTMGLGGFSTHDASFGYFDSPAIEAVSIVFMLIAGINFGTLFLAISGRSLSAYFNDPEAPWFIAVTLISIFVVGLYIWKDGAYPELDTAMRHAAFNVVSIATTTGYASVNYALWPIFAPLWMLFLSSFATSAGSTGGGIKMVRALLLYKQVYRELLRAMHPGCGLQHSSCRAGCATADLVCGSGLRLHVHGQHRLADTGANLYRARHSSRPSPPLSPASITPGRGSGSSAVQPPMKCSRIFRPGSAPLPCCSAVSNSLPCSSF